ncbi:hypothetical protein QQ054_32165 [Oscillatoria amoena NRMC-F 0135]|nr:hypothetical protein [Oscillatoria amoena NRMC-F 0135]
MEFLQKHPVIGFCSSILSAVLANLDTLNETVKAVGVVVGVMVGIVTFALKLLELNSKIKENRRKKRLLNRIKTTKHNGKPDII